MTAPIFRGGFFGLFTLHSLSRNKIVTILRLVLLEYPATIQKTGEKGFHFAGKFGMIQR